MKGLVIMHDQQAVTSSLQVAETFGKNHKHVLDAISNLAAEKSAAKFFAEDTYENRGKQYPMYYMNRDGFTLLAMGFTGAKALQFKLAYIDAFNKMETSLQKQIPQSLPEALRLAADIAEERDKEKSGRLIAEQQVGELQPKASYYDKVLANPSLVTISVIAKDYGLSARAMNAKLHSLKVQYKQGSTWLLYSKYQKTGWTHSDTTMVTRKDGTEKAVLNTKWTQKGRLGLYELLKDHGVLPLIEQEA
ncbi:phage regulatory protein/antirepressor Ant [Lacticaseibacillus songhuajiangensis]|uniref:phage regulatory protein/antirepressor Ant n=1 Tax=Lacticaseibacillus songhuajiangensis TaxID=1296539 RepID=UPI000F77765C|nr:phage regulatory protein/antirepressor Ant [Lacticaseibacillus songhuajiangensis]